ncbi:MAG: DUF4339 domain-containing protein [Planctomycetes bacterium]|nr:DUF4339 domain-containing protein [Planctomycetota bacterium]
MQEFWVLALLAGDFAIAVLAGMRGRNAIAWFFLALFLTPFLAGPLLFIMPDLKEETDRKRQHYQRQRTLDARERAERRREEDERKQERLQAQQVHAVLLAKLAGPPSAPLSAPNPPVLTVQESPVPPPLPGDGSAVWFVAVGNEKVGPMDLKRLEELCRTRKVDENSLVWAPGMTHWVPLRERADLLSVLTRAVQRP